MSDLRGFLDEVRRVRKADLLEVDREVDPRYETAAIVTKLEERGRSPVVLYKRVRGCRFPLVTNVCGSMGRLALGLGCSVRDVADVYGQRALAPVAPTLVAEPPCQEVVVRGDAVDLELFPALVYHASDADAPYLTAAIAVARDPDTGKTNLSYHRFMIAGPRHTGIYMEPGRHLDGIFHKYAAQGRDTPIAVFIGAHPAWSLGALYAGSADVEEYDVIGGMLQAPLELAPCVTDPDLVVPARTEFVLEGRVSATESIDEGPFGEFTGYGTGVTRTPVFHVDAITHRTSPIVQDIVSGRLEHLMLSVPALQHRTLRDAQAAVASVTRVALVAPLTAVVALDKRNDAQPRELIEALLGGIYTKHLIVVDADVDPNDLRAVLGAVALHAQADRDVHVMPDQPCTPLDPSSPGEDGRGAKMGIDATRPLAPRRPLTKNTIPADVLDRIDVRELLRRK